MRRHALSALAILVVLGWLGTSPLRSPAFPAGPQQNTAQEPAKTAGTITAESNLVLVDAVVTDKKWNYIRDLEQKDFKVYEDNEERAIASFSRASGPAGPNAPAAKRYLVLFFDDSTMDPADQMRARQAAGQFIEKTASPDRLMAVVDFSGSLRLVQNFTADAGLLKDAVKGVKLAHVNPNEAPSTTSPGALGGAGSLGSPFSLSSIGADFGARTFLLAIRDLMKKLQPIPGRKRVVLDSCVLPLNA